MNDNETNAKVVAFANWNERTHVKSLTVTLEADFAERHLLAAAGTGKDKVVAGTALLKPVGVVTDEGVSGDRLALRLLTATDETVPMVAAGAVAAYAEVYATAVGRVSERPTTPGAYWRVGRALTAAGAAGDLIEVEGQPPVLEMVGLATARTAQAALTLAHTVVKQGTGAAQVSACAATEAPIGVVAGATAQDGSCTLQTLEGGRVLSVVAAGAIAVGASVFTAAAGKVQARPTPSTTATTVTLIGMALTASAGDGDVIAIMTQAPVPTYLQSNS